MAVSKGTTPHWISPASSYRPLWQSLKQPPSLDLSSFNVHIVNIEQLRMGPVFPLQKAFCEALERRDAVWASSTLLYLSGVVQHSTSSTDCIYSPSWGTWSYRDYRFRDFGSSWLWTLGLDLVTWLWILWTFDAQQRFWMMMEFYWSSSLSSAFSG